MCEVCGRGFAQTGSLTSHRLIHSGEKPHMCPTCGKQFRSSTAYSQHQRVHRNDREFCGRTFLDHSTLKSHLQAQTGARKHAKGLMCPTCGKQFRFYSCLYVHLRLHTGEKPYPCPLCGWRFRSSSNMNRHLRTQHYSGGVKPFKCDVCGHAFSRAVQRAVHLKRLHGVTVTSQPVKTEVNVAPRSGVPVTSPVPSLVSSPVTSPVDTGPAFSTIESVLDLTAFAMNFES